MTSGLPVEPWYVDRLINLGVIKIIDINPYKEMSHLQFRNQVQLGFQKIFIANYLVVAVYLRRRDMSVEKLRNVIW